ncbi:hypothetical protein IE53DRAFT_386201 [Violaceomyces palustris]|uniref:Uncharacterized protein n=1 Tax=Violaceomyces palustris TaxID=1673888 RepID=A0ACD0P0G8_9BASI|nr:hypothetical protein IE53DRAFT_386201 [Violaceomyces palustris]
MAETPSWSQLTQSLNTLLTNVHSIASSQNLTGDSGVSFSQPSGSQPAKTSVTLTRLSTDTSILAMQDDPGVHVTASPSIYKANEPSLNGLSNPAQATASSTTGSSYIEEFQAQDALTCAARELKPIGDVLRTDRLRSPFGKTSLSSECVALLKLSLRLPPSTPQTKQACTDAQIEAMRVLANLCIDHAENRDQVHLVSGAATIVQVLSSVLDGTAAASTTGDAMLSLFPLKTLTLIRTSVGALLNLQLEHADTRASLLNVESIKTLARVGSDERIYSPNAWTGPHPVGSLEDGDIVDKVKIGATIASWSWRVVQEVCDNQGQPGQPARPGSTTGADDDEDDGANAILTQAGFGATILPLLHFYRNAESKPEEGGEYLDLDAGDVTDLIDADAEILQSVAELIEKCSQSEVEHRKLAVLPPAEGWQSKAAVVEPFRSPLDFFMSFVEFSAPPSRWSIDEDADSSLPPPEDEEALIEALKSFSKTKAAIARAIVAIAGEDDNMSELFGGGLEKPTASDSSTKDGQGWFISRLKSWIKYDAKKRDDLVSCGMLALGNLARKDSHCLALVNQHNLAPFLASLMSPSNDIKVSHGLVSLLKNLSIPSDNKSVIGELGVIENVSQFLRKEKDMVQPLQFGTIGLLKHLCSGVPDNAIRLIGRPSEASAEPEVKQESALDLVLALIRRTDDVPTRMESTRVIVNVIKTLWSSSSASLDQGKLARARKALVRVEVAKALTEMVRGSPKYPVLVNEGIFALTLLGSDKAGARLVAVSLLSEPSRPAPDSDSDHSSDKGKNVMAPPRRRSTYDSANSTSSQPPPPPPSSLDMVCSVLARKDARMPPQFACNACMLIMALSESFKAEGGGSDADEIGGDEAILEVATRSRPALVQLSRQGPQEAIEPSEKALALVESILLPPKTPPT